MGAIMRQWALLAAASAFVAPPRHELGRAPLRSTPNTNNPEELDEASMTELRLRMSRESLENRYRTSVTRRKRAWLPYDAAAAWARRLGLATEDDWRDWLEQGEGRSSYVPSKPAEVYAAAWVSWRHFLVGDGAEDEDDAARLSADVEAAASRRASLARELERAEAREAEARAAADAAAERAAAEEATSTEDQSTEVLGPAYFASLDYAGGDYVPWDLGGRARVLRAVFDAVSTYVVHRLSPREDDPSEESAVEVRRAGS